MLDNRSAGDTQNRNLHHAKAAKRDEFYTQLADIERELTHYLRHFSNQVVLCNCDDPRVSNFFNYFSRDFESLRLKQLITTCYKSQARDSFSRHDCGQAIYLQYPADKNNNNNNRGAAAQRTDMQHLQGDGDFRSDECIALLKRADIVVTNPPFSLFREYVAQLIAYDKKFLIVGNFNAITYKEIFKHIRDNKIWMGASRRSMNFKKPDGSLSLVNACWYTNLDHSKRHDNLVMHKTYNANEYAMYDNYDAIEVGRTKDIPRDYAGVMGVPITFMDKYNPDQFDLIGMGEDNGTGYSGGVWKGGSKSCLVNGTAKFKRLFIKHKRI